MREIRPSGLGGGEVGINRPSLPRSTIGRGVVPMPSSADDQPTGALDLRAGISRRGGGGVE